MHITLASGSGVLRSRLASGDQLVLEYASECEFLLLSYHVQGKFHLVGWNKVCSPIVNWRLGFWRITTFIKLCWVNGYGDMGLNKGSLGVVSLRLNIESNWVIGIWWLWPHGCSLWRGIWANWDRFSDFVSIRVGNGTIIRFWHDVWCGDQSL